ncbi:ABC transporter substrate-binding protein [Variovorax defluvii]|uniref:ABC transporter substrate-binding protein n=1 Tax=Variovorax defluvii TaxID=913761 RepID=A0ABP8I9A9_9BURK
MKSIVRFGRQSVLACVVAAAALPLSALAQEIPVMSIAAITGPAAFAGVAENNGIRLAVDEANQKGAFGAARIRLIEGDNGTDKAQAISLAEQAIKRHQVVLSIGPTVSPDAMAIGPVFNQARTPMLSFATSNAITQAGPYVFRIQMSPSETVPPLVRHIVDKVKARKVAIVFDRSNDGFVEGKNIFADAMKAAGAPVVAEEAVLARDSNFLPLVTKLSAMDIDGIYFITLVEQAANIMIQLKQAGLPEKVKFYGEQGLASPRLTAIGGKAVEGTTFPGQFLAGVDRPLNRAFEQAYRARYKTEPDFFAAVGYSAGLVAAEAIRNAGPNPTRDGVRDAIDKLRDVPVVVGNGLWNHKDRNGLYGVVITSVKDGKFVAIP